MNVLIIEDEQAAAKRLAQLISVIRPSWKIVNTLESVEEAIQWFEKNKQPDLVFSDIQLADGIAFEIYLTIDLKCPVIFTTAYDNYAIRAFQLNSIDYLLKPIVEEQLKNAILKLENLQFHSNSAVDLVRLAENFLPKDKKKGERILIKYGQKLKAVDNEQMAYFFIDGRNVMLMTFEGKSYPVDENLDQLEDMLDKSQFFRANRQTIVNFQAINDMVVYSKSRIKLVLIPPSPDEVIVSGNRSSEFKNWLKGAT